MNEYAKIFYYYFEPYFFTGGLIIAIISALGAIVLTAILVMREKGKTGWLDWLLGFIVRFWLMFLVAMFVYFSWHMVATNSNPFLQRKHYSIEKQTEQKETTEARCLTSPDGVHICEIDKKIYTVKSYKEVKFPEYIPKY